VSFDTSPFCVFFVGLFILLKTGVAIKVFGMLGWHSAVICGMRLGIPDDFSGTGG
jgi:hypothetical protein